MSSESLKFIYSSLCFLHMVDFYIKKLYNIFEHISPFPMSLRPSPPPYLPSLMFFPSVK